MFARPSILPWFMISSIEESKKISLFCRNHETIIISLPLCEKTFIEKFSGKAEDFLGT